MERQSIMLNPSFGVSQLFGMFYYDSIQEIDTELDRCVELHNQIAKIGWEAKRNDAVELRQSWFKYYGQDAENVRHRLSPTLVAFLEQAWTIGDDHSFFYYVAGLSPPQILFSDDGLNDSRYLTLYAANDIAEHPGGLIYDQQSNTAILQMTIEDAFTARNGRQPWYPLAIVLDAWRDMIRARKIQAVGDDVELTVLKFDPWISVPYSDLMLQESVEAFNELVKAIESRIPGLSPESGRFGLVDDDVLASSGIPAGFAHDFIQQVQRPSFKFIAPGMTVPPALALHDQPFFDIEPDPADDDDGYIRSIPPILLFSSDQYYEAAPNRDISGSDLPFPWPYSQKSRYPSGLYLNGIDRASDDVFEDEGKLVLPFGIGARGYARTSDGARFGENTEDKDVEPQDTFADLYQPGYQPFTEIHDVRLVKILRSWTQMVQRGDWQIDSQGVVGSMEEWRKADTDEHWSKFVIPVGW